MSMEKAIASGKEHRKKYRGTKAFDCSCRNHGTCDYCKGNRLYKFNKNNDIIIALIIIDTIAIIMHFFLPFFLLCLL